MIIDPKNLAFRPMVKEDLTRLHVWLNAEHVRPFFRGAFTIAEVMEEFVPYIDGETPIHPFIATYEERPIGMMAWERLGDFPDVMANYEVTDPNASNCDILIGEIDYVHKGLGTAMVGKFLKEIVFRDPSITSCVIDPKSDNKIAIRSYEKAGFRPLRRVIDAEDSATELFLMSLSREDLLRR